MIDSFLLSFSLLSFSLALSLSLSLSINNYLLLLLPSRRLLALTLSYRTLSINLSFSLSSPSRRPLCHFRCPLSFSYIFPHITMVLLSADSLALVTLSPASHLIALMVLFLCTRDSSWWCSCYCYWWWCHYYLLFLLFNLC